MPALGGYHAGQLRGISSNGQEDPKFSSGLQVTSDSTEGRLGDIVDGGHWRGLTATPAMQIL